MKRDEPVKLSRKRYIQVSVVALLLFLLMYVLALVYYLSLDQIQETTALRRRLGNALVVSPIMITVGIFLFFVELRKYK